MNRFPSLPPPAQLARRFLTAAAFLPFLAPTAAAQRTSPDSGYQVITKGLLGGPVYPVQFRTAKLRLETRNLIMGPGRAESVPTPVRTIMELRGGALTATLNGKRQEHVPGDFWVVNKGDTLSLENQGDVAIIRAVQISEGGP